MKYYKNILNKCAKTELGRPKFQSSITEYQDNDKTIYINVYRWYNRYNGFNHSLSDSYFVYCQYVTNGTYTKQKISNRDVPNDRLDLAIVNHIKIFGHFGGA